MPTDLSVKEIRSVTRLYSVCVKLEPKKDSHQNPITVSQEQRIDSCW